MVHGVIINGVNVPLIKYEQYRKKFKIPVQTAQHNIQRYTRMLALKKNQFEGTHPEIQNPIRRATMEAAYQKEITPIYQKLEESKDDYEVTKRAAGIALEQLLSQYRTKPIEAVQAFEPVQSDDSDNIPATIHGREIPGAFVRPSALPNAALQLSGNLQQAVTNFDIFFSRLLGIPIKQQPILQGGLSY